MSSSLSTLTGDLLCSICLDVFTDPVSTPCGHNFCKRCLNNYWNDSQTCSCPFCKETFRQRPDLKINITLREILEHYKNRSFESEVVCDICEGRKLKALKSCLMCHISYCKIHLEPHLRVAALKKHKLMDPVSNPRDYICHEHNRPLELFCRDDQTYLCSICCKMDHRNHNTVFIEEESEEMKNQLIKTQNDVQMIIQEKEKKIQDVKLSADIRKRTSEKEKETCVKFLKDLFKSIERYPTELLEMMEEQQQAAEKQDEELIKVLEQEITELKMKNTELNMRNAELDQLSHTDDHRHFLQIYSSSCRPTNTRNCPEISVKTRYSLKTLTGTFSQMKETVEAHLKQFELKWMQQYAVDVTLDPDTAHPKLILSDDEKEVRRFRQKQKLPDKPQRFNRYKIVLGKEGFSTGRFYFEVQVEGKTKWKLGVARDSVDRKGSITLSPRNGFWTLILRNLNQYKACAGPTISLSLRVKPRRVGVFVDYEEGLVSFYDVESSSHIYSYTGQSFSDKLYPYLNPGNNNGGKNSAPLIITSVKYSQ